MGKNIKGAIYFDVSNKVGLGHLKRCKSLIKSFDKFSVRRFIIINPHISKIEICNKMLPSFHINQLLDEDLAHFLKKNDIDFIIIDKNQPLNFTVLLSIKKLKIKVYLIDENSENLNIVNGLFIGPLKIVSDIVHEYPNLKVFSGWEYIPIDAQSNKIISTKKSSIKKVLVIAGSVDPENLCENFLSKILMENNISKPLFIEVVIGSQFNQNRVIDLLNIYNYYETTNILSIKFGYNKFEEYFTKFDVAVVSFGLTAYEIAYCKIPQLILGMTDDHLQSASVFKDTGIAVLGGLISDFSVDTIELFTNNFIEMNNYEKFKKNLKYLPLDSNGGNRIIKAILESYE